MLRVHFPFSPQPEGTRTDRTSQRQVTNHPLSFRCDHEVVEGFAADGVDAWAIGGIHFHDRIDGEERPIAFDQDRQAYWTKVQLQPFTALRYFAGQ